MPELTFLVKYNPMPDFTLLFSLPNVGEWLILLIFIGFVVVWFNTIVEIIDANISTTLKAVWLIVVISTGFLGALVYIFTHWNDKRKNNRSF